MKKFAGYFGIVSVFKMSDMATGFEGFIEGSKLQLHLVCCSIEQLERAHDIPSSNAFACVVFANSISVFIDRGNSRKLCWDALMEALVHMF